MDRDVRRCANAPPFVPIRTYRDVESRSTTQQARERTRLSEATRLFHRGRAYPSREAHFPPGHPPLPALRLLFGSLPGPNPIEERGESCEQH